MVFSFSKDPSPDPSLMTDNELIAKVKKDSEAFKLVMDKYELPLTRYLVRLTGWAREEVEDILQESFIKAYRNINDFDTSLKLSSWLYRIAHNQAIDTIRHLAVRPAASELPVEDLARFLPAPLNLENQELLRQEWQNARSAITRLPERYRNVLILRFLEEKDYEEIMDILKIPKGTVATLIRRGRSLLMKELKTSHFRSRNTTI